MKKRNWVIGSILTCSILTMAAAGVAHACNGPGNHNRGGFRGDKMMQMMGNLDLSKEQRQTIRKIKNEQRDQMDAKQDEMIDIRKALRKQARAENYDAEKVQKLASTKAEIMADMTVQRIKTINRIRKELTPEQIEKMDNQKMCKFKRGNFKNSL